MSSEGPRGAKSCRHLVVSLKPGFSCERGGTTDRLRHFNGSKISHRLYYTLLFQKSSLMDNFATL